MKDTIIIEKELVKLSNPVLIEGLPGLGLVGWISTRYLAKQLGAKVFARLYSPHFPYYVISDKDGNVRLPRCNFLYWKNISGSDLILLIGDGQAQTIDGQYEVASKILDFSQKYGVNMIVTIGGYSAPSREKERKVIAIVNNDELLEKIKEAGAEISPAGNPVVGTAGLLVGLASFRKIKALCLLGETPGHIPDFEAAKSVLKVLSSFLKISIDPGGLDKEIEKVSRFLRKVESIEERIEAYEESFRRAERIRTTYIS